MSRGNVIKYEGTGEKGKKGKGNPKKASASGLELESAGRQGKGVE